MKITWTAGSVFALAGLAALAAFGVWLLLNRDRLIGGVKQAANLVNPASSENIANRAVTATVSSVAGREETLGGWLAEIFDPATRRVNREYQTPAPSNPLPRGTGYDSGGGPAYG
jgi:hypothetical protein